MNLGIRWKVALGTLAAVFVGLAVAGWLVIRSVEQTELSRMAETLETSSGLAAMTLRPLFDQSGSTVPGPLLHRHHGRALRRQLQRHMGRQLRIPLGAGLHHQRRQPVQPRHFPSLEPVFEA